MNEFEALFPEDADAGDLDQLLRLHVRDALRSRLQQGRGRATPYNNLVSEIRRIRELALEAKDEEQVEYLTCILDALTACVSTLHERKHEELLKQVLNIPIWTASPELRAALLRLVTHVVVANSALVPLGLRVLTLGLQPPPTPPVLLAHGVGPGLQADWEPSPEVLHVQGEVIEALEKVLTLVPTAPSRLVSPVAGGIPHRLREREVQCLYMRGALALAEAPAAAAVREGILAAAIEHLLGLDVEIRWQDIVDDEDDNAEEEVGASENEEEDIFELEGQTEHLHLDTPKHAEQEAAQESRGGWEGAATGAKAVASTSGRQDAAETQLKLDSLMGLVFQHLQRRCAAGQLKLAWATMLYTFNRLILDTYRSKFTQFLVFFLCEKDPGHCIPGLLTLLLDRLSSPKYAPISRSSAAAYLASFLARAAYIPDSTIVESLQAMANFCLGYCREQDARERRKNSSAPHVLRARLDSQPGQQPSSLQHQVFYAACQALLYVLCYRMGQLMSGQPPHAEEAAQKAAEARPGPHANAMRELFREAIPSVLRHRLAPLRVCLPTVVDEFTRQAQRHGLMDCAGLLSGELKRSQRPLEMFFPFDPFLLRRSAQYLDLDRTYVRWQQVHTDSDDEEPSNVSSDEEVEAASELGDISEEDSAETSSSSGSDSDSDSTSSSSSSEDGDAQKRMATRHSGSMALWLHAPIGMRPISAGASRKRPASSTPGSDQGYLHGGSFDTNGTVSPTPTSLDGTCADGESISCKTC